MHRRVLPRLVVAILWFAGCGDRTRSVIATDYQIPAGYTGWVTVEFSVAEAAPLVSRDGVRQIRVSASGTLATATPQQRGIVHNRFFFVDDAGHTTAIEWPESMHGADPQTANRTHDQPVILRLVTGDATEGNRRRTFEQFYVGRGPSGEPPGVP